MGLASKLSKKIAPAIKKPIEETNIRTLLSEVLPEKESSKNFKERFKDTAVVDEDKKPARLYHGRTKDYDTFDTSGSSSSVKEIGTHFGSPEQADEFASKEGGNIVPAYVNIKNPLRLQDWGGFDPSNVLEQLRGEGFDNAVIDKIEELPLEQQVKATVDLIKSKGYDGIVYLNRKEGLNLKGTPRDIESKLAEIEDYPDEILRRDYGAKDSYIIFDPTQAKSPFNRGTYSETDPRFNYNKGGSMPATKERSKKLMVKEQKAPFSEGGLKDEGGSIDPVSGNDVPAGSLKKEVRDDIPARLSEGEFVFPADVVRYIGLERLMQMRQAAKEGLSKMEDMGQMGNSEEAVMDDDVEFESFIDQALREDEDEMEEQEFQQGGMPYVPPVYQPATGLEYNRPKSMQDYLASARQTAGSNRYGDTLDMLNRMGTTGTTADVGMSGGPSAATAAPASPAGSHGGITAPATGMGRGVGVAVANVVGVPAPIGMAVGKSIANQAAVATNQAAVANNLSVANFSQEAVNAAVDAAAQATTANNATPGSVAAAAANAASAVDNTDAMDAMMSVTNNFSDVAVDAPVSEAEAVSTEAATADTDAATADAADASAASDAGDAGDAGSSDGGGDAGSAGSDGGGDGASAGDAGDGGASGDGSGDSGDGDGGDGGFQVGGFVNKKKKVYNKKSKTRKGLAAKK